MTPTHVVLLIAGVACAFAWIASLVTGDTSWVDRLWSIVPVLYVWVFAVGAHLVNVRLDLMAALVTIWGIRLTFNFARKGGYTGVEDYRWQVLRDTMRPWQFQFFNLFFIVLYQNFLLVLISLPAYNAYLHRNTPTGAIDAILVLGFLLCTVGETVADQQQWNFQVAKRREIDAGRTPKEGFVTSGLFRLSRHPNYFFEIAQWWLIYLIGAVAARGPLQWTIIGPVLLSLLFVGSTSFTEKISKSRYPEYALYQRRVSSIIPWFPRSRMNEIQIVDLDQGLD
ncbi:MAG: DUF1295 domain-containing protein [Acidimicrobiales bacterium]